MCLDGSTRKALITFPKLSLAAHKPDPMILGCLYSSQKQKVSLVAQLEPPKHGLPALDDYPGQAPQPLVLTDPVALVPGAVYEHYLSVGKSLIRICLTFNPGNFTDMF